MTLPKRVSYPPPPVPSKPHVRFGDIIKETALPDTIVRQTSLMQLTRVLDQLSNFSLYANEIASDLVKSSVSISERVEEVQKRIDALKNVSPNVEEQLAVANLAESMNHERFDWKSQLKLGSNLFTKETEDPSLRAVYETCNDAPNLSLMDPFRADGQPCMKFYSYPEFFAEEWKMLMQKEFDEERKRKKERRELKKKAKLQRPTAAGKLQVQELQIKRYNSQGELITEGGENADTSNAPLRRLSIGSSDSPYGSGRGMPAAVRSWNKAEIRTSIMMRPTLAWEDHGRPSRGHTQVERSKTSRTRVNTPPPPPPPPPPPLAFAGAPSAAPPSGGAPTVTSGASAAAAAGNPTLSPALSNVNFLNEIRSGQFTLKKVDAPVMTAAEKRSARDQASDVAAILMRRVAMEMSDSEDEDSADDDDWD
ncbi:hypothetical protein SpCBS45565_g03715 [Spizellomyces sp. 'palustris']|nr:hypothetical protein SpCBS45565_g03715 [Spizellomyces sp. 'palustris']